MIIPDIEERLATVVRCLEQWRVVKKVFVPVLCADALPEDKAPPAEALRRPFIPPYALFEEERYLWFTARVDTGVLPPHQKAYFCLDHYIDGYRVASTLRPQGLLYVDGVLAQGVDINHGEALLSEGKRDVALLFYSHHFERYLPMDFSLKFTDERIEKLYYDLLAPLDGMKLLSKNASEYAESAAVLEKTLNLLDFREVYSEDFYRSLEEAEAYLQQHYYHGVCGSKNAVVCIGHSHIDVAWMWDLHQTKQKTQRTFSTVLQLMEEYPEYRFMSSQPQLFAFLKERDPALYARVREKIAEGRWETEGAMWLEADCNLTSGESLVRQIYFGKKFFKEEFGKECDVVWLPDVFGYSAQLPQIMQKSGLRHFVTTKIGWNDTNRMPYDFFTWQGIDGSEVFAYFLSTCNVDPRKGVYDTTFTSYCSPVIPRYVLGTWNRFQQKEFTDTVLMTYGWGDGGGGPTREDLEFQRRLSYGLPGLPKTELAPLSEALARIRRNYDGGVREIGRKPKWNGELYFEYHRGTLTSVPRVKYNNRKGEFALLNGEFASVLASTLRGKTYPSAQLDELWKLLLLNQFHDVLPGSSIEKVYKDSDEQFEKIFAETSDIVQKSLQSVADNVKTAGGTLVFNFNGFAANGTVRVDGKTRVVTDIPSFGYKVVTFSAPKNGVTVGKNTLENKFYKVVFDESGAIVSLTDKRRNDRQIVAKNAVLNQFVAYQDTPYQYDNWEMTPYHKQNKWILSDKAIFEKTEDGDRAGFKITKRYGQSAIVQKVWLYADVIDRIDFETSVDWKEKRQLLKVLFPFDLLVSKATYDIQFGSVERATHDNTSWDSARFESVAHKWVDMSENDFGVALLNDGKYGFGAEENVLSMTVLKSGSFPYDDATENVPPFTYSLLPHADNYAAGGVAEKSYVLNRPLHALSLPENKKGTLPENYSFVRCHTAGVFVETVKQTEDGGVVIRMFEAFKERKEAELEISRAFSRAALCDLTEKETEALTPENNKLKFTIKPFEIVTIKIK